MIDASDSGCATSSEFRVILLLDMDAFFASVEERDNPALKGTPVIVGNTMPRSIVSTASRVARKFGIHSAMPMSEARQLCPHGKFIMPRIDRYKEESRVIGEIVSYVAGPEAVLEKVALDEIYVDLSAYCQADTPDISLAMALPFAAMMQSFIFQGVGLTCTIGIAANKMLAKLASDKNKPNGFGVILESNKVAKLSGEPVKVLCGVGEVKEAELEAAGIKTVKDIREYTGDLCAVVGKNLGLKLKDLANGIDPRPVKPKGLPKSISKEHTFTPKNEADPAVLDSFLLAHAHDIENELKAWGLVAYTVVVVACHKFGEDYGRQVSLSVAVSTGQDILAAGQSLIKKHGIYNRSLYKLGLGVKNLQPPGVLPAKKKSKPSNDADNLTLFEMNQS